MSGSLQVFLGNGASENQRLLPGTANPVPEFSGPAPSNTTSPDALTAGNVTPPQNGSGLSVTAVPVGGGVVEITETDLAGPFGSAFTAYAFDVQTPWRSVQNARAQSDRAENVTFDGFNHVDVAVGSTMRRADGSTVLLQDVKRGNVATFAGDDTVTIEMTSDDNAAFVNEFRVNTGRGDDTITLRGGTYSGTVAADGQVSPFAMDNSGALTSTFIEAGDDDGRFEARAQNATATSDARIFTGATYTASPGDPPPTFTAGDIITLHTSRDRLNYEVNDGVDLIYNFDRSEDVLEIDADGLDVVIGTFEGDTLITFRAPAGGGRDPTDILDDTAIRLVGVSLTASDISLIG